MRSKTAPANGTASSSESRPAPDSRAAQAAARVAERFAHAPSYNEVLADEARAAVRAAKAASRAAQEAHAAVQLVLEGLEAASSAEPDAEPAWEPQNQPERVPARQAGPVLAPAPKNATEPLHFQEVPLQEAPLFTPRWEPELPDRPAAPAPVLHHRTAIVEARAEGWREPSSLHDSPFPANPGADDVYTVEPAQPIYANLIQFPREMVATRKVRPRLAEGPLARSKSASQLSIFEVDPAAISTEPAAAVVDVPAAPDWMRWELIRPELPAIELEAQPHEEILEEPATQGLAAAAVELAPLSRRLLAIVVDCALIAAAFLAAAMLVAANASQLPGPRIVELGAALGLLAIGAAYQAFFFTLTRATLGMRYAGIRLCTLDGFIPSRAQRCRRLMALLLSVLPLGLGLAWALFDDNRLTWHDRLSRTYLRKR